jgi:crossover junction endodeoxyribonuclease RusA
MDSEYLVLPYPMSANRYWVKAKNRIIVSNEGRAYKMAIMAACKKAKIVKVYGKIKLTIGLCQVKPKDAEKRKRTLGEDWADSVRAIDTDNSLKPTLDALKNIAFEDDKFVKEINIKWLEPVENGRTYVKVERFESTTIEDFLKK